VPTTLDQAADLPLAAMTNGSVRSRAGDTYKPSVIRSYEQSLDLYIRPSLGCLKIGDMQRRDVQRLADELTARGLEPSTVRNALMPLRVIQHEADKDETEERAQTDARLDSLDARLARIETTLSTLAGSGP
jgi:hypothetical protein